ncbi:MAG: hypothetical protein EKK45_06670 [Curvibacter sp.]|nr:MAG: hypothetical protein EKK45_06670 [Curvibacter sp.]
MKSVKALIPLLLISAVLVLLYGSGIHNSLIFDDVRLLDGSLFKQYNELSLNVRLLSYGSFVWVRDLLGEEWWKQRWVNLAFHVGTVWLVFGLCKILLENTIFPDDIRSAATFEASRRGALMVGIVGFAFNPVAVYAVAYLIQRSILMAAFFTAGACLAFLLGLTRKPYRWAWFTLALISYLLAVASKEYAVTAIVLALPLGIFIARPNRKVLVLMTAITVIATVLVAGLLATRYSNLLGQIYEDYGKAYAKQLDALQPGAASHIYILSIINEMTLFFRYGLLWFFPNVGWMSIDLYPTFPLSLLGWPQTVGALAYVGLLLASGWLLIRRSDVLGLVGLCLLIPLLLFMTEFSTVWVQDPFVLYRSYLWALPIPALIAIPLIGFSPRKLLYPLAVLLALVLGGLSFERIQSLQDPYTGWADAASKVDLKAPANTVGRWRPLLNLGGEQLRKGDLDGAYQSFRNAVAFGEPFGPAHTNFGIVLLQRNQAEEALKHFDMAMEQGYGTAGLYFQRGEAYSRLRKFTEAYESYSESLKRPAESAEAEEVTHQRHAKAAAAAGHHEEAIKEYLALIQKRPDKDLYRIELAFAYLGQKQVGEAMALLDPVIAQHPSGLAYYARGVAHYIKGDKVASTNDVQRAIAAEPNNPLFKNLQGQLQNEAKPKQ